MLAIGLLLFLGNIASYPMQGPELPDPPACKTDHSKTPPYDSSACDAAIGSEMDSKTKAELLFRRAYAKDERQDYAQYQSAIDDLNQSLELDPKNWHSLHERGFVLNEIGDYERAKADLDAEIAITPNEPRAYQERALSRFWLGDLEGSFDDSDQVAKLLPNDINHLLARAYAAMWVGRFDSAQNDIKLAAALAARDVNVDEEENVQNVQKELDQWTTLSGAPADAGNACHAADKAGNYSDKNLIGDCTRAFVDAATPKDKADALTVRSIAWLVGAHDDNASITDSRIAVRLAPDNPALRSNLGFAFIRGHHSRAAIDEFDKSIALQPDFVNYAGRAEAKMNVNDFDGADADAKKSLEFRENDIALTIRGDVAKQKGDMGVAKDYWIRAYKLGDRDDGLIARLKEAGIAPPAEGDKEGDASQAK